ncbi:hypothetical protein PFISCL1PPCAC_19458, partial [Pristionchus fissidentatus]
LRVHAGPMYSFTREYVTVGKDDTMHLVCPGCRKTITNGSPASPPRNLDCGHAACTDCAQVRRRGRLVKPHARCHSCNHVTRRPNEWLPPINIALLKIANALNARAVKFREGKVQCGGCNGFYEEKEIRVCLEENCDKFRKSVCISCFVNGHGTHAALKFGEDVHKSIRGNHKRVDQSNFSDRRILEARGGEQFVVSATYLCAHSLYFEELFYGNPVASTTSQFMIDIDSTILGDLLDMIYPCSSRDLPYIVNGNKTISCCDSCDRALPDRVKAAIELGLESIADRMNRSMTRGEKIKVYSSFADPFEPLKKYVLPDYYSNWDFDREFGHDPQMAQRLKPFLQTTYGRRNAASPAPVVYSMPPDLPDSRVVHVGDASFIVSASVLCLFAPWFLDFFYSEERKLEEEMNFTLCSEEIFFDFLEIVNGKEQNVVSKELKTMLKNVGADLIMENYGIS